MATKKNDPRAMIAAFIKDNRTLRGWTQTELARRIGIEQQHVSRLERGTHYPSLCLLHKIAVVFGQRVVITFGHVSDL
jgi:transcriptional regulator with XRE-family HTH domain